MGKAVITDQKERVGAWVAERVKRTAPWSGYQAIGLELNDELIAGVVIDGYVSGARCSMHCAGTGKTWLNREFLFVCFDYAFRQLGCRVIVNPVDADNLDSLRFTKHIGFEEIARIPNGSGDCDLVLLAMQRMRCRWLNMKRG